MRSKEDILKEAHPRKIIDNSTNSFYWTKENIGEAILEVLLDIRDLLAK